MEEEVLYYLEGMRMLPESGTSSWKQHYWFFSVQIQENSGGFPKRRIMTVKNGGCSKQINQSPNSDSQEKLCYFLRAISEIMINPNKKDKRKFSW